MIIRDIKDSDLDTIYKLYQKEEWRTFTLDILSKLKDNSNWIIVENEGSICGFARYITDNVLSIYLCELIVSEKERRKGIGRIIIANIFKRHKGLRIDLSSCKDEFYDNLHFRCVGKAYRCCDEGHDDLK